MDDVRLYNRTTTRTYVQAPTFDQLVTYTGAAILYGTFPSGTYSVNLVISGNTYTTTGDGPGKYKTNPLSPALSSGVYNVTMNYTTIS